MVSFGVSPSPLSLFYVFFICPCNRDLDAYGMRRVVLSNLFAFFQPFLAMETLINEICWTDMQLEIAVTSYPSFKIAMVSNATRSVRMDQLLIMT